MIRRFNYGDMIDYCPVCGSEHEYPVVCTTSSSFREQTELYCQACYDAMKRELAEERDFDESPFNI